MLPSVVNVRTKSFGGGEGDGSGVVLDRAGIILTNNHVIEGTTSVTVVFNDDRHKQPLAGTVIGTAPERDLAVIHVAANDLIPLGLRAHRRCGSATPSSRSASRSGSAGRA